MRRITLLVTLIMLSFAVTASAAEELHRSIESFDFFIDGSSSMDGRDNGSLAKVLRQINERIPELDYPQAGMHTFSPEKMILDFAVYQRERFSGGINQVIREFPNGSNASLGKGLDYFAPGHSDMLRKGAVIVFTDGDYGTGRDSLNETKIFYLTQPEMCMHFVSLAKSDKGQKLIDEMAAINSCSVSVLAGDLVDNEANLEDFVRRVFYDASEIANPVIDFVMLSIPFAFNSDALDENTAKVADALVERLKANPALHLKIDGFTCNLGPLEYNLALSVRRAATVKNYIVNHGIEASRIETGGFGVDSPRYDNNTREGRSLNRRVEFTFFVPESTEQ